MFFSDEYSPEVNVAISKYENGQLVDQRVSHNVVTNTGRTWLSMLVGSDDYAQDPPPQHITSKIKYMGFGCGGVLQTGLNFARTQSELVTVTSLEDPIAIVKDVDVETYLKQVRNQLMGEVFFPGNFRTRFICDFVEAEIAFPGNTTRTSQVAVGTAVPISEAGLYLSTANPKFTPGIDPQANETDPTLPNDLVAYNIFEPITITPNVTLRVEWELRF
jgi:hypothetical protein